MEQGENSQPPQEELSGENHPKKPNPPVNPNQEKSNLYSGIQRRKLAILFQEAYDYLSSLILHNTSTQKNQLKKVPYWTLSLIHRLREKLPLVKADLLVKFWWHLRLGGVRAKTIIEYLKKNWPNLPEIQRLEDYRNHSFDNYLSSEAGGFQFESIITLDKNMNPNDLLIVILKNLIRNHHPKNQQEIRITILDHDDKLLKLSIPYQEGLSDDEIEKRIIQALQAGQFTDINLSERERAELCYLGYNAETRNKDKNYQTIYQNFSDSSDPTNTSGDYLIQIGSNYKNPRDPRSLFAVGPNKLAVQLRFSQDGQLLLATRYNHQYFDGIPARQHTDSLLADIYNFKRASSETASIFPPEITDLVNRSIRSREFDENPNLPLAEAWSYLAEEYPYKTIQISPETYLTATEIMALVLAVSNDIDHYHQLVAQKEPNDSFYTENPYFCNIQPVIIAPKILLNPNNFIETVNNFRQAVRRAFEGRSDAAIFASIAGRREKILSRLGKILNKELINLLIHAQGMISPVPNNNKNFFTTAFSDAYIPAKIDLTDPVPSMGIIGVNFDKETGKYYYAVRLLPSQAQRKFKEKVEQLYAENLSDKQKAEVLIRFTEIIVTWDRLLCGQGPYRQISLDDYEKVRDQIVNKLASEGLINLNVLGEKSIQQFLNEALQEAANEILDPEKIARAREKILDFLEKMSEIHSTSSRL